MKHPSKKKPGSNRRGEIENKRREKSTQVAMQGNVVWKRNAGVDTDGKGKKVRRGRDHITRWDAEN